MVKKILLLFFSVSVFFLLFASPLSYYSSSQSFYAKHMMQEDRALTGQSMEYVQNVYRFIRGISSLDPIFPSDEKSHLEDVRQIFRVISVAEIVAVAIFVLVLFLFVWQRRFSSIIKGFLRGSLSSLVFFLLLFLAIRIDFPAVFTLFHAIFFPQGNRSFDQSSILISLFPLSFFEAIAIRIFLTSAVLSLLVFFLDLMEKIYWRKKRLSA